MALDLILFMFIVFILSDAACQGRVKLLRTSGKFGQRPCLFLFSDFGIKNRLSKQTVKLLTRRPSHLDFHCLQMYVRIYLMSEVT